MKDEVLYWADEVVAFADTVRNIVNDIYDGGWAMSPAIISKTAQELRRAKKILESTCVELCDAKPRPALS